MVYSHALECLFVAAEAGQAANDLQPGIARHVICGVSGDDVQVPQQGWLDVAEDGRERALVTSLRVGEIYRKSGAKHQPVICPQAALRSPNRTFGRRLAGARRCSLPRFSGRDVGYAWLADLDGSLN
jgi:hypothetical protein